MIIKAPLTRFNKSNAFKINKKIIPKLIDKERKIFLKKILKVNINAKNNDIKNGRICVEVACIKLSG